MINKKSLEEEGTRFSTDNLLKIIIFILVLLIGILIIVPRLAAESEGQTLFNFGRYLLDILGV